MPAHASVPLPLRYFDCVLVLAFVPFALLAGLPALGVARWARRSGSLQRALGVGSTRVAGRQDDFAHARRA